MVEQHFPITERYTAFEGRGQPKFGYIGTVRTRAPLFTVLNNQANWPLFSQGLRLVWLVFTMQMLLIVKYEKTFRVARMVACIVDWLQYCILYFSLGNECNSNKPNSQTKCWNAKTENISDVRFQRRVNSQTSIRIGKTAAFVNLPSIRIVWHFFVFILV